MAEETQDQIQFLAQLQVQEVEQVVLILPLQIMMESLVVQVVELEQQIVHQLEVLGIHPLLVHLKDKMEGIVHLNMELVAEVEQEL